ncbi:hypothetical protein SUGI_0954070, partial [Cryptomeria japonica]
EMISYKISETEVTEVTLSNLKIVRVHIGTQKIGQAVNFLDFLLKNSPLCAISVFLSKRRSRIMLDKLLNLEKESRLSTAIRGWSTESKAICVLCGHYRV